MIIDTLDQCAAYENLHPLFKAAFAFLRGTDLAAVPLGRTEIDGQRLFALTQEYPSKPVQDGRLEAHRRYVDIQLVLEGEEWMGYAPLDCQRMASPYDPEKDIAFFEGEACFTRIRQGMFAIFFPHDAHLPGRHIEKPSNVRKIVLKVALSQ